MTTEANARMQRPLDAVDNQIAEILREEAVRQATGAELIPSENLVSEAVLEAMGSIFTNKYAEGYPGRRYREAHRRGSAGDRFGGSEDRRREARRRRCGW